MTAIHLRQPENTIWLAAAAALLIHMAALAGLDLLPRWKTSAPAPERNISVELVKPPPALEKSARLLPETPAPAKPDTPERVPSGAGSPVSNNREQTAAAPQATSGLIRAKNLYAAAALAEPQSRRARTRLRMLVSDDRAIQLCNLEAMEQVARWDTSLRPDHVIAYARGETRFSGGWLEAEGAALHSDSRWFELDYRCRAASDLESVTGFEFRLGQKIPYRDWRRYSLPYRVETHD